jgi:hypothetical protein
MTRFLKRILRALPAGAICGLALGAIAFAQPQSTGELDGTVIDQTGGVIVGASATLTNGQGQSSKTVTNDRGMYVFERVPAGRYTLTVRYPGFLAFTARVDVRPETRTTVDGRLTVGISVSSQVKSTEQGLSTDPRNNVSALLLTGKDLAALPDDPERLMQRILEMAGSTGRPNDVALYVDGFREYQRFPPKATIEMIRINSNPFSAEFAQPSLDRVEIMTKPGSDTFHGEATGQAGSSVLDAPNPLSATKPRTSTVNYHGYLQGPIAKGRLDFLAYAGQWQQDDTAVVHATVLDPATSSAQSLATAISAPTRITSAMLGMNFRVATNQRFNVSYTRNTETQHNLGLDTGFDLPQHGYNRSSRDEDSRIWWTSMGTQSINDVRFELTRNFVEASPLLTAPALLVLNAFNAGGNQDVATRATTTGIQGSETFTIQRGKHTVKTGVRVDSLRYDSTDRSGFGGTFFFGADVERDASGNPVLDAAGETTPISPFENYRRTLLGLRGYAPSQFWIVRGNPSVGLDQWDYGSFVLDDWSLSKKVLLSYGVRQDGQTNVQQRVYLAPRASLSWLLDEKGKNAIKLGAGIFNGQVDPAITLDTKKTNGTDRQLLIVERPPGFPAIPSSGDLASATSAIHTLAPDLRLPYSINAIVSYERQLPAGLFAVVQYTYSHGLHLLRLRDVSNPGATAPVFQFESSGRSLQREVMTGLRGNISRDFTLYANYIYGKKYSDTDGPFTTPANSGDLSSEYGPAADDLRHQFVSGATIVWHGDLTISPYVTVASGRPFNITTGRDNNGDTVFSDRPAFALAGAPGAIQTSYGWLNPNPQPGDPIIPRNLGRMPPTFTLNFSVTKTLFVDGFSVTIYAENLANHPDYVRYDGVLTSSTFGQPVQALNGRRLLLLVRGAF